MERVLGMGSSVGDLAGYVAVVFDCEVGSNQFKPSKTPA